MSDMVKLIIQNFMKIAIGGFIFWSMVVMTLQLAGAMDIETRCPSCVRYMDRVFEVVIKNADAATYNRVKIDTAPMKVMVTFFPPSI